LEGIGIWMRSKVHHSSNFEIKNNTDTGIELSFRNRHIKDKILEEL